MHAVFLKKHIIENIITDFVLNHSPECVNINDEWLIKTSKGITQCEVLQSKLTRCSSREK
jgi:hypothetical protein